MKVLITGGAGFIGSTLADRLLERGDEVVVIDNYATGRRDNLTPNAKLAVVEGSIADEDKVAEAFAANGAPDVVIHAAAAYKDPEAWAEDASSNVLGSANVVRAAEADGVGRLIYFQTALCYGLKPLEQPITLAHPVRPEGSSYAISKTAGEQYIALSSLDWISFRLANAYGPRNLSGPLPTFYARLTQEKSVFVMDTRRDFIFVDDLVDCVMKAVDGVGKSGPYHISSGSDYSIKELYDCTIKALDMPEKSDVEVRPRSEDDAATILLDPSETEREFDWQISTSLEDGVSRAIDYYREYGIEETFTHLKPLGSTQEQIEEKIGS
ncbi:MAG TPA: NAD-dependent epimerase/dehydratase family protein [Gemmatimonadaceae bacterium]|nr:NAD-dependent epimerase/dehydratase family protein [Gemmatimonadaceae bacterium]